MEEEKNPAPVSVQVMAQVSDGVRQEHFQDEGLLPILRLHSKRCDLGLSGL